MEQCMHGNELNQKITHANCELNLIYVSTIHRTISLQCVFAGKLSIHGLCSGHIIYTVRCFYASELSINLITLIASQISLVSTVLHTL